MGFSRSDRRALLLLSVAAVAFWGGMLVERHFAAPPGGQSLDEAAMDSMEAAWTQTAEGASAPPRYAVPEVQPETFPFDPNTADSTTLLRLGLAPWQVRSVYAYRARGGRYHRPEDFRRLPGMTPEVWQRLGPAVRVGRAFRPYGPEDFAADDAERAARRAEIDSLRRARHDSVAALGYAERKFEEPTEVDLNAADTTLLKRVPGIGSYRARQIVRYRERLGGFVRADQLLEIEGMPEEVCTWFRVDSCVRRLQVNTAPVAELARHPYIGLARARAIADYRHAQGHISDLAQLRLLDGFDAATLDRLAPYVDYE